MRSIPTDEEIDNDLLYTDGEISLTPFEIEEDKLYRKQRSAAVRKLIKPLPAFSEPAITLQPRVSVTLKWFDFYYGFCDYLRTLVQADTDLSSKKKKEIIKAASNDEYFEAFLQNYFNTFVSTPNGSCFSGNELLVVDEDYYDCVFDWREVPGDEDLYLIRALVNFVIKVRAAYPIINDHSVEFHLYW